MKLPDQRTLANGVEVVTSENWTRTGAFFVPLDRQDLNGMPLMPTIHPAYLLRNQALTEKRKVWEDMLTVMEKLALPISEKQRGFFLTK